MLKITFVCLGNICRSPMAELIFTDLVKKQNLSDKFEILSRATSNYEIGNPIYYLAERTLAKHNIHGSHFAKKISAADLDSDFILVMDDQNYCDVMCLNGASKDKVFKLCDFTDNPRDVADPWYTRNFDAAYADILDGCTALLHYIKANKLI